jgi:uncharacterized membrane protein
LNVATALKLAAWGAIVAVALQVAFHFVFQIIGYNSSLLSVTLLISLAAAFLLLAGWKVLKRTVK